MLRLLKKFASDETGISLVEYGLIAAIITVATTFAVSAAGYNITDILG
ncbi:Flp family type IVb pilin [Devosia elaeis]|jgi:Flp pilus assembly pilin Flp|nr:Flp family type IVb pilin [Devosia elaeis]